MSKSSIRSGRSCVMNSTARRIRLVFSAPANPRSEVIMMTCERRIGRLASKGKALISSAGLVIAARSPIISRMRSA
jgi:hypothetical protein